MPYKERIQPEVQPRDRLCGIRSGVLTITTRVEAESSQVCGGLPTYFDRFFSLHPRNSFALGRGGLSYVWRIGGVYEIGK